MTPRFQADADFNHELSLAFAAENQQLTFAMRATAAS
jgi:hypothetical protein